MKKRYSNLSPAPDRSFKRFSVELVLGSPGSELGCFKWVVDVSAADETAAKEKAKRRVWKQFGLVNAADISSKHNAELAKDQKFRDEFFGASTETW